MKGSDKPYEVGRGRPPKHGQIKPGEVRNPGGKTSQQRKAEVKAGELAAQIQAKMLQELVNKDAAEMIEALSGSDLLRLIKDAMDREYGTATQKVDNTSSDGSMTPKPTMIEFIAPKVADESDD